MKKTASRLLVFFAAIGLCFYLVSCKTSYQPILNSQEGINFKVTTLANAKEAAKTQNKPLFVFAHASWCPTCKKMEQEVLIRKELGATYNQDFVNVAIDIDSPAGKELQKTYPIRATPTLFFFKADGSLAKKTEGFADVEDLQSAALQLAN
ncbi:thioredoxin family protein [Mucilaginibacter gotjawali]|uniref:Thiol:disulfide interchange protein n=1 Tax=Mucilaginibacter gotjawali TaxID=1550579 RepID=A0A839S8N0_9SPHI|nr:thioredoxin family protein [Mucilaginibacter gotjawali]MBB3054325.1 thiol:disulfide interchange protein [Mucilaginibacter gotjawali]